ncbi:MAG: hypothetical protein FVQ79_09240 [Planctomycetes bacterium]|nr:hypothetical protein [Planctomycetota bacterium]
MAKTIKQTTKHIRIILLAASLLLIGAMAVKVFAYTTSSKTISVRIANALDAANGKNENDKTYSANYTDIASELKKKNVFAPPPSKKKNPVKKIDGILGDSALIKGKFYKVGDKIGDAELISIEPTHIVVKFDGKETKVYPLAKPTEYKAPKKKTEKPKKTDKPAKAQKPVEKEPVEKVIEAQPEEDPLAWIGVKLSPALKAKFLEKWNSMTDEQKEQAKEQWSKMSQEEKEKAVEEMEKDV